MQNNERKVVELNINDVLPNRFQPRIKFDENSINELATSIKKYGVIQPIVVRQIGDKYEIIAGERRYKASVLAGKSTIPAIVSEMSDKDSVEIALIENVQREDLTPIEKAISYKKILDMGYISQDSLAQKIGKSQSAVANTLRLLNLSEEAQEALLEKRISERHARSLLKVKEEKDQVMMLNRIINERLTVRRTDEEIEKMYNGNNLENNNEVLTEQPVEIKEEVVSIPDISEPIQPTFDFNQTNEIPGFMNIESIEQNAQNIIPEPKEVANIDNLLAQEENFAPTVETKDEDILKPGKFFTFDENDSNDSNGEQFSFDSYFAPTQTDEMLSVLNSSEQPSYEAPAAPTFDQPAYEAPVAPAFDQPSYEVPAAPTFEQPSYEVPAAPTFDQPAYEVPVVPTFDQPSYEVPAAPTFDQPSYEAPVTPTFDQPSYEVPAAPTFDQPAYEVPVEPTFDQPSYEVPAAPTFDQPSYEAPVTPTFEQPSYEAPVAPLFDETNYDVPFQTEGQEPFVIDQPIAPEINFDNNIASNISEDIQVAQPEITETNKGVSNMKLALDIIRECESKLHQLGYEVDFDEIDLENIYQVIINISK